MDTLLEQKRAELKKQQILSRQDYIQNKQPHLNDVPCCPFCGHQPKLISTDIDRFGHLKVVRCVNPECNIRPFTKPFETVKEAKQAWSKRAK